jgi:hypothetical protein
MIRAELNQSIIVCFVHVLAPSLGFFGSKSKTGGEAEVGNVGPLGGGFSIKKFSAQAASKTSFYPVLVQKYFSPRSGENVSSPQPFDIPGDLDPWGLFHKRLRTAD